MYRDAKQWRQIRRSILENGAPKKKISRETGISRKTINKILTHKDPPLYGPRRRNYPKLGPYIPRINQLLIDKGSLSSNISIRDIVHLLRREQGFSGSYDSVRNYVRHLTREDETAWERAYNLIIWLPKPRAIDFVRLLSRGNPSVLASVQIQSFVRDASCPDKHTSHPNREKRRLIDIEWMRRVLQNDLDQDTLHRQLGGISELPALLRRIHTGRLSDRHRSLAAL